MTAKKNLRDKISPAAVQVATRLVQNGFEAYVVGGAVRDLLLGSIPKDVDITTNATPEQVRSVFGRRQCIVIGRRFKLAQVRMGDEIFEVSTFRRKPSHEESKGRDDDDGMMIWNDNEYGTMEDDASRRDFTVNSLYLDVVGRKGVIDMTGGLKDLKAGVVRVIGNPEERFIEDPVRMLRALKLIGLHGFKLHPATAAALKANKAMISMSSPARLYEELLKILFTGRSLAILTAFHDYGFLTYFWPDLEEIWSKQDGVLVRRLLKTRDAEVASGNYSHSRSLALATVVLPVALRALRPITEDDEDAILLGDGGAVCLRVVRQFFSSFVLPRLYAIRVKEILLLIPALSSELAPRFYRHREYKYGRLLLQLLVKTLDWDPEIANRLPPPEVASNMKRRRRRKH
ncbi:MAG: polynucleotide adenylyltransferase PcnB [Lentisphaerae bacterium]|jgi:poly(A) polymerase|nr:polynucleotide adenylyltransferase PcnB [Lentisphaerota bacterium]